MKKLIAILFAATCLSAQAYYQTNLVVTGTGLNPDINGMVMTRTADISGFPAWSNGIYFCASDGGEYLITKGLPAVYTNSFWERTDNSVAGDYIVAVSAIGATGTPTVAYQYWDFQLRIIGSANQWHTGVPFSDLRGVWSLVDVTPVVSSNSYIWFYGSTPADDATIAVNNSTINVAVGDALTNFTWNWNGSISTQYDNSLVLAVNFDQVTNLGESATSVKDTSIYQNDVTPVNDAVYTAAGKVNGAFTFDANGDYCMAADNDTLDLTTRLTCGAWVYPLAYDVQQNIICKGDGNVAYNYILALAQSSGNIYIIGGREFSAVPTNTWSHVFITYDGTDARAYLNGSCVGTNGQDLGGADGNLLYIGWNKYGSQYFNGKIDEVRVYNRCLSDAEVWQLYCGSLNKYATNRWTFTTTQTNLTDGSYDYSATESGAAINSTETRTLNVNVP
jgi:hypothetical protein